MKGRRKERVAELVRQELADMLLARVKDPTLQGVTLTEVQVSPDLSVAIVYFAADERRAAKVQAGLERASSFMRRELGRKLKTKRTPELRFRRDQALEEGMHIDSVLKELAVEEETS